MAEPCFGRSPASDIFRTFWLLVVLLFDFNGCTLNILAEEHRNENVCLNHVSHEDFS